MVEEDTICAVATAVGEGGIGIIRISGPQAVAVVNPVFRGVRGKMAADLLSYQAAYGHIIDPAAGAIVDEVLLLVMRTPRSYTREDVVEIHCHGGPVPLRKILALIVDEGARLAEPGEFTKRAFLNGRLDLSQAEAVIDIIRAKTDLSLKMAVGHLAGNLSQEIRSLRSDILQMIAHLEASIDFPEEDIEELAAEQVAAGTQQVIGRIAKLLDTAHTGRILREGLETVIIGKPNVGKSSLLNALLREKRAIVTDIPGTTRDVIEEYVNIRGIPLKIMDTAGIRETADVVEKIGVERARELIQRADLILVLLDISTALSAEDRDILDQLPDKQAIILVNKTDLPPMLEIDEITARAPGKKILKISVLEGFGLDELENTIGEMVYSGDIQQAEGAFVDNVRHANILATAKQYLEEVLNTAQMSLPLDCLVVDLRAAWEKLGEISGDTVNEDIIDQIFRQFCLGK